MNMLLVALLIVCAIVFITTMSGPLKENLIGDERMLKKPFDQPPGAVHYVQGGRDGAGHPCMMEHFIVSTETTGLPAFSIRFLVLARLSKAKLEGYSDDLFKTVYKSHTSSQNLPPAWGREEKAALLLAMSSIPVNFARLECRKGRLVLHWYRDAQAPSQFNPGPEQLLESTKTMLEGLAIRLADFSPAKTA